METDVPEDNQEDFTDDAIDWDRRVLCSDGNCIGVIGSDGRCKECGNEYEGDLPDMSPSEDESPAAAAEDDPLCQLRGSDDDATSRLVGRHRRESPGRRPGSAPVGNPDAGGGALRRGRCASLPGLSPDRVRPHLPPPLGFSNHSSIA